MGVRTRAVVNVSRGTATGAILLYCPDTTGAQPGYESPPIGQAGSSANESQGAAFVLTNTSSQIIGRANTNGTDSSVTTLGWRDPRGKDA